MKKRLALLGLFVLVLALAATAVACGTGEDETTTTAGASAVIADVVNVGIDGDPTDLDPFTAVGQKNGTTHPIYEQTLGYLNADGSFSGVLMESYNVDDSRTVTVTLYEGIVDQAGNPFTAADAAWGLNKHVENQNQYAASIETVEATGDLTFVIHFNHDLYVSDLTNVFTNLFLVTQAAWEASPDHMVTDPVTTAPYKVVSYTSGAELVVEKADTYWKTDESKLTPVEMTNVNTINFKVIMDANQMALALQSGDIDFAQNILLDNVESVTSAGSQVKTFGEQMNHVLYPNCNEASPLSDPKIREAVFQAIDVDAIVLKMFGDTAVPSKAIGAPTYPDYDPAWADADYFTYDVEAAKATLAEAGYNETNKLPVRMLVLEQPFFKALMTYIQGSLNDTGVIDATLTALNGPSYFPEANDPTKWDLQHFPTFSSDFLASVFTNLTTDWNPEHPITFVADEQLQSLISTARGLDTHSNEATAAAQDYVNQNAYAYGVSANYINAVYPSWCTELVLSDHLWILPNASTYTEK